MLNVAEVRQLFDNLERAASKSIAPHKFSIGFMDAGRRTEVSMAIALALQYPLRNAEA
jgi:hypothetical protein